ncbi:MAG TPA: (2Fe-2S)-binding protein [Polyangiaceae bacterium]|jgi:carbon-monoxide dehydrogenase small subunit|nr:MAG: Nicotinate dehydrogenase small FeS subunit [Deltaproteobacteria bacterium ADurb.Bin207]HNS97810.1 (2Fe-2S)-binding protein [Polyangiaceae bacterium]HNZ21606.1 (2Fe-2S)-binding protein [Polyangiaceae bacterium]HOD24166.1 (2Fe-2S)-binding protein [Polyangiaceae bacterium]HOE48562.1 (2Fe-2S)-binding protein [Polyangiaceae bacterium]
MMITIELTVNGSKQNVQASPLARLIDVLREKLRLTGTKEGCGEGECGTCTVLLDGEPVNACLVPFGQCEGRHVVTIEGLVNETNLSSLADAFIERGGAQCGICTPGMIVSSHWLLQHNPTPSDAEIREALAGNICRCTGYTGIVEAVAKASGRQGGT